MVDSIGIIGMGWVGSSVAISILQRGLCRKLLLNDAKYAIAEGEAMDFNHGSSFLPTALVKAAPIAEMLSCSAIVITAGRNGKPGESRLDLLASNIQIAKSISEALQGYQGMLIILANPVDVLTYFYQQFTGLPAHRVIGTGTMLDTSRLRELIGRKINVDPKSVHAQVIGEHGDSESVLWSSAHIGGIPLRKWKTWSREFELVISEQVRTAAYEIIQRKGATNHAIGLVTATLLMWIVRGERRVITVSTVMDGVHGISDVALSLPSLVSANGVEQVLEVPMDTEERDQLYRSAEVLKKSIAQVIEKG